jgi:hypothetical protein
MSVVTDRIRIYAGGSAFAGVGQDGSAVSPSQQSITGRLQALHS